MNLQETKERFEKFSLIRDKIIEVFATTDNVDMITLGELGDIIDSVDQQMDSTIIASLMIQAYKSGKRAGVTDLKKRISDL